MKHTKKLASMLLALIMTLALAVPAFAQEVSPNPGEGKGSITITNAAKGETYTLYRLFDATVSTAIDATTNEAESIVYTGTIPDGLSSYFTADANGYITAADAAWKDTDTKTEMSDGLKTALEVWAKSVTAIASVESDGTQLEFTQLKYGYYVVVSTQGTAVSVDSTNPHASIVDKNSTVPSGLSKKVDETNVNIGDLVTYTVTFKTANYDGAGEQAREIVSYTITDTLPEFLKDVTVTGIVVDNDGDAATTGDQTEIKVNDAVPQFGAEKKIVLDWYDEDNARFLYDNGATVTITYTAVVTDMAAIDGDGNTNEVTVQWTVKDGTPGGMEDTETIYTYAIAVKKVDKDGNPLAGAKFRFPFYVTETPDKDGVYVYAGITAGTGLTNQITTPADGVIVIKGVASGMYSITEVEAPSGYNKLSAPVSVTATQTGSTTTQVTIYLDENGNVVDETKKVTTITYDNPRISTAVVAVLNKTGSELPSTGGMGTTIFYVLGTILLIGAAVLLITKKRMGAEK